MEFRVLQYFLAVTREGNISAAAQSLNLSQPSLSRQLRDLEAKLGVTLFIRGKRHIELTEEEEIRAGFAIDQHKKNVARLKDRIHELEANGDSLYFVKK